MKNPEERYFCEENENMHIIGEQITIDIKGEKIEVDAVVCPHCEGIFAVESWFPDNIHSVVHCPFCCLEVGVEDKNTFLGYTPRGDYNGN